MSDAVSLTMGNSGLPVGNRLPCRVKNRAPLRQRLVLLCAQLQESRRKCVRFVQFDTLSAHNIPLDVNCINQFAFEC